MSVWILATLFAASVQALRFLLQKRLAETGLTPVAATFARFIWAPPVLGAGLLAWSAGTDVPLPRPGPGFWPAALVGGVAQIMATVCIVALFKRRNFAVGIAFSKTTVLITAAVGFVVLGEAVSGPALAAMVLGVGGVLILSVPVSGTSWTLANAASGLGLASGALFSVSAVGYRAATLAVPSDDPILRASVTLALVTLWQAAILAAWLGWRDPGQLRAVIRRWRVTMLVGATSMAGSLGWFTAYTLQNAAIVNAVGQVELALSMALSWLVLGERATWRETLGIAIVGVSVVGLILLG